MGARRGWVAAAVCLMAAGACEGPQLAPAQASLQVSPASLDWGLVALGDRVAKTLTVRNLGLAPVTLVSLSAPSPFSVAGLPPEGLPLAAGQERTVEVIFAPQAEGPAAGQASLEGDDGSEALGVPLSGEGTRPMLEVAPESLPFGQVPLGAEGAQKLSLRNGGRIAVTVTFAAEGTDAAEFVLPAGPLELGAGAAGEVAVLFRPNHLGTSEAQALLRPCPTCPATTVALSGEGVASCIELDPLSVDFGSVKVGTSSPREVVVRNAGQTALDVVDAFLSAASSADFQFAGVSAAAPRHLEPGSSLILTVTFSPTVRGAAQAALRLRATGVGADGCWAELRLSGNGGEGCLVVAPTVVDFGVVALGMSGQRRVQVANAACGADVWLESAQVVGEAAFTAGATKAPPFLLAQGESADVVVRFTPTSNGPASAALHLVASDPDTGAPLSEPPPDVLLSGLARTLDPCAFTAVPPRLDFGAVAVGRSATLGFKLTNTGQDSCYFSNLGLSAATNGAFSADGASPGFVLAAGESHDVLVRFLPTGIGSYSGALEGYVSDPADPYRSWPITGLGDSGCLAIEPGDLDFGTVYVGCPPPTLGVSLINRCSAEKVLSGLTRGAGTSLEFTLASAPSFPYSLRPGGTLSLGVTYAPVDDGLDSMPLYLNDGATLRLISVRGRGVKDPWRTDSFDQIEREKVDVLFVLDNSGSMSDKQSALASNLGAFLQAARAANVDYRLAVTTTGLAPSDGGWTDCPGGVNGGEAGRLFPADNSSPRILTPLTADAETAWAKMTAVGVCHWLEQGLEASLRALSTPLVDHADDPATGLPSDGNLGFYRPEARLVVIYVSDEDDQSLSEVAVYESFLRSLKPDPALLSVSAVVTPVDASQCPAGTASGTRYAQLVGAMGGVVESICTGDWAASLGRLGDEAFGLNLVFPLSGTPADPGRIEVTVDGVSAGGWSYDAGRNAVIFTPLTAPQPSAHVEVRYPVGCG